MTNRTQKLLIGLGIILALAATFFGWRWAKIRSAPLEIARIEKLLIEKGYETIDDEITFNADGTYFAYYGSDMPMDISSSEGTWRLEQDGVNIVLKYGDSPWGKTVWMKGKCLKGLDPEGLFGPCEN